MTVSNKFKSLALAVSAVSVLTVSVTAQAQSEDDRITLNEAVAVGVATNPEYGVVASSRRATDEELRQAKALFLPSVDFRADTGYEHTDDPSSRAGEGADEENLWRYDTSLTLTQMLFDGWEAKYETERQHNRVLSSAYRVKETAELVGLSIVEAYLEVLRQRKLLEIAKYNVIEHLSIMDQISDNVAAGRSTQADMEQAKARLASARAIEANAIEALRRAEANYNREVGEPPKDLVMPIVPADALSADVEEEVKMAVTHSPTVDVREADIMVAESEFKETQSTIYPQVDLQLNARQGHNLGGVEGRDRSASALVVMNWNLYRGGADMARAREHIHRHLQAKETRDDTARSLENDVRQTWALMEAAGERARQYAAQAAANVEVVKAYKDQFLLDRRTLLDVLDAQNELFVSRSNTVNAEFVEMVGVYRLIALKGELYPTLGVDYPRESSPEKM